MAIQQLGYNNPGNNGPLGISDGQGGYIYYPDYNTALKNAKAGDTIVQFADIVDNRTYDLKLKDGVNINLNGFTYTITQPCIMFWDGNVAVTCSIINGSLKATGANSNNNVGMIYIQNASSKITTNCYYESNYGATINNSGTWYGGQINTLGTTNSFFGFYNNGGGYNIYATATLGGYAINNGGNLYNCVAISSSGGASMGAIGISAGRLVNCIGISSGASGIYWSNFFQGGSFDTENCISISTAYWGATYASGAGIHSGLIAISTANIGIHATYNIFHNSFIYSTANLAYGLNSTRCGGNKFYNTTLVSTANAVVSTSPIFFWFGTDYFIGCTINCQWNNPSGHGLKCLSNGGIQPYSILKSNITVSNVGAKCITSTTSVPLTYVKNTFQGSQQPIGDNVIQAQSNNIDIYGNITIG